MPQPHDTGATGDDRWWGDYVNDWPDSAGVGSREELTRPGVQVFPAEPPGPGPAAPPPPASYPAPAPYAAPDSYAAPAPYAAPDSSAAPAPYAAAAPGSGPGSAGRGAPDPSPYGWSEIPVGEPGESFEPRPPTAALYRPDTVHDGWSTDLVTVRLASVRGYTHRFRGTPREDDVAVAVHAPSGTVVFAVADGVSAAEQSYLGAALACRGAVDDLLGQLDSGVPAVDWKHVVDSAAYQLVARVAGGREPTLADSETAERRYATTLVAGTVRAGEHGVLSVSLVQVGDSGAWLLDRGSGRYEPLVATKTTAGGPLISSKVSPLPRVPSPVRAVRRELTPGSVLLVGTDGFGDPLGDGHGAVGRLFHTHLRNPPPARGLAHLLDFSRETFDDDRTLLAVWPRHLLTWPDR
ncbi:protein phosphatase 2C domain-containing protein [Streptomyces sp. HPF1205]|uniref:protein phosphatase 2C domain-containing protein n=1 Tax=Streptomyces sp. HPF1205 TaxID=2873262 RepID=UPI001CEC896B|nr:protein phosphatase 2C domain-containing protein [Streptomyces sp. HPF1205]